MPKADATELAPRNRLYDPLRFTALVPSQSFGPPLKP